MAEEFQNGRRYHAFREDEYTLDLMDLPHPIYTLVLDGEIHIAHINNPQSFLVDGLGIGAVDFAGLTIRVPGNNLSPIQPKWVPLNCQFEIDDFESEKPYTHPFDYIHGRELSGSICNLSHLYKQAFTHLRLSGFFEVQSFTIDIVSDDGSIEKAPYTKQALTLLQEASAKFGKPIMKDAGFTNVVCKIVKAPSTSWVKDPKQKEIRKFLQAHQIHSVPAYTNALLSRVLGWDKTEIDVLNKHHGKPCLIYGRKL
ncbi:uncharacterized protein BDW43DRAFT_297335 [Aspergillus alliaceus]|uniref:uncharacterized protein n=1 Tax=Petromyces alliaceus TaxID=209559 RepID=UPI0012A70FF1|nr:uncharacterized protein BDW43DRAFT_297335 [Aspergillus alliaceus]KAB8237640.1 hypothetical protein BDW43DRAFT_297335 [Aspergillus alliaceus]